MAGIRRAAVPLALAAVALIWSTPSASLADAPAREAATRSLREAPELRGRTLTVEDVIELAARHHPRAGAAAARARAAEASALQARLPANPQLQVDVENVGGDLDGLDASEVTVWLSQRIDPARPPWGDRVSAHAARAPGEAPGELEAKAALRFVDVWIEQRRRALADERTQRIRSALDRRRGEARRGARAELALRRAALERARSEAALAAARTRLAASWGGSDAEFAAVDAELDRTPAPLALDDALGAVSAAPAVARSRAELERRREALRLARLEALPDVTLAVGYRRLSDTDRDTAVFSVSVPIPLFDRHQGGRRSARLEVVGAERAARATRLDLRDAVADAHLRLALAHADLGPESEALVAAAEEAWREALASPRRGAGALDAVLEAARVLFDARSARLEAIREYQRARIELAHLLGRLPRWAGAVTL